MVLEYQNIIFAGLLLKTINKPIVATSVNYSGDKPLYDYKEIIKNFPQINYIVNNNVLKNSVISGKPSKIISVVNNIIEIVRE